MRPRLRCQPLSYEDILPRKDVATSVNGSGDSGTGGREEVSEKSETVKSP